MQKPLKWLVTLAIPLTALVIAAGCGSDDDTSSTSAASGEAPAGEEAPANAALEEARANIESQLERPTELAITDPLESPPPEGKLLLYMPCAVPASVDGIKPTEAAAEAVGWRFKSITMGLTPEDVKRAWGQAVRESPDAVIAECGFPTSIYKEELAQLTERGVPFVNYADPHVQPPEGVSGIINGGDRMRNYLGVTLADWIAVKSDGNAKVLYVYSSTFPVLLEQMDGYKERIADVCPDCETEYYDAPGASVGKDLASKIASVVQANPDTNYIVGGFNDMLVGVPAALKGVGADASAIKLISPNLDGVFARMLLDGEAEMNIPQGSSQARWQSFDVILRAYMGQDVSPSTSIEGNSPWILTKDNFPTDEDPNDINQVKDYDEQFKELWGVAG